MLLLQSYGAFQGRPYNHPKTYPEKLIQRKKLLVLRKKCPCCLGYHKQGIEAKINSLWGPVER